MHTLSGGHKSRALLYWRHSIIIMQLCFIRYRVQHIIIYSYVAIQQDGVLFQSVIGVASTTTSLNCFNSTVVVGNHIIKLLCIYSRSVLQEVCGKRSNTNISFQI